MQGERAKWIRVVFWIAVVVTTLFCLIFPGYMRSVLRRDRAQALPQSGTATVAVMVPSSRDATGKDHPAQLMVRFQGKLLGAKEVLGFGEMVEGHPVQITYRVGKSGRIYIDRAQPLPHPTP